MNITRSEFLKDVFAAIGFAVLPGRCLFAAPSYWKHSGKPNLVFGVIRRWTARSSTAVEDGLRDDARDPLPPRRCDA